MQSLLTYALCHHAEAASGTEALADNCRDRVIAWLDKKGTRKKDGTIDLARGKRTARLTEQSYTCNAGRVWEWNLTEPLEHSPTGEFRTTIQLADTGRDVHLYLTLKAGYAETRLAPEVPVQVRPPRVLFDLAGTPGAKWRVGNTLVRPTPDRARGEAGSEQLSRLLEDPDRRLPVVVVSEYQGYVLHPDLEDNLARDLYALAAVVRVDPDASWGLTARLGREWSCYLGSIRIYWPGLRRYHNPFDHRLWTAERIMEGYAANETRTASERFATHLFNELRRLSTFSVRCPDAFPVIRQAAYTERVTELRKRVQAKKDATRATANLADDNKKLRAELSELRDKTNQLLTELADEDRRVRSELDLLRGENARLRTDLENERLMRSSGPSSQAPVDAGLPHAQQEAPVLTVEEAVDRARSRFSGELLFGEDVDSGVSELVPDTGPPNRVFDYLAKLAEAASRMQTALKDTGSAKLGQDVCKWLTDNGATASPESYTVQNNPKCRKRRTWGWGDGTKQLYELHMKPKDATDHGRCVRIYFKWCDDRKKFIVGWVGRHPD